MFVIGTQVSIEEWNKAEENSAVFCIDKGNLLCEESCSIFFAKSLDAAKREDKRACEVEIKEGMSIVFSCFGEHL